MSNTIHSLAKIKCYTVYVNRTFKHKYYVMLLVKQTYSYIFLSQKAK